MKSDRGFSLIEVLITVALISIFSGVAAAGLGTALKVLFNTDERETAKNLAVSQMEYVMEQGYLTAYSAAPISSEYAGYSAAIFADNITSRDNVIQKIKVIVSHQGRPITMTGNSTLESYKVKQ
jgi:prepilin-type N-terminal cleavage/methylation domain-containing protein